MLITSMVINVLAVSFYRHGSQGCLSLIHLVISSWTMCNAGIPAEFPGRRWACQ